MNYTIFVIFIMYVTVNVGCWMLTRTTIYVYPVRHPFTHFSVHMKEGFNIALIICIIQWTIQMKPFIQLAKKTVLQGHPGLYLCLTNCILNCLIILLKHMKKRL